MNKILDGIFSKLNQRKSPVRRAILRLRNQIEESKFNKKLCLVKKTTSLNLSSLQVSKIDTSNIEEPEASKEIDPETSGRGDKTPFIKLLAGKDEVPSFLL